MRIVLSTVCLLALLQLTNAQSSSVAPEVLRRYNPSIVNKVFEISKQTPLTGQQQLDLAQLIQERDSTVTRMLMAGVPDSAVLAKKNQYEQKIYSLSEIRKYNDTIIARKAREWALAEMATLSNQHRLPALMSPGLHDLLFVKYQALVADLVQRSANGPLSPQQVRSLNAAIYTKTDSIINQAYVTKYFQQLDAIRRLPDSVKGRIAERYYKLGWGRDMPRAERMQMALRSSVADTTIYGSLYRYDIQRQANLMAQAETRQYARYRPTRECYDELVQLIDKKNYQLVLISESYSQLPAKRDSLIFRTCAFFDSLTDRALNRDGALLNASYFSAAIKFKKLLKLTEPQLDSLLDKGLALTKLKDSVWRLSPLAPFDSKDYENQHISRILTEEQLATLLTFKYQRDAEANAANDWKDLEKRGLTREMDPKKVMQQLVSYYIQLKSASTMYAYDLEKQTAYYRNIRDNIPRPLKILQYARKNNITSASAQNLKLEW